MVVLAVEDGASWRSNAPALTGIDKSLYGGYLYAYEAKRADSTHTQPLLLLKTLKRTGDRLAGNLNDLRSERYRQDDGGKSPLWSVLVCAAARKFDGDFVRGVRAAPHTFGEPWSFAANS